MRRQKEEREKEREVETTTSLTFAARTNELLLFEITVTCRAEGTFYHRTWPSRSYGLGHSGQAYDYYVTVDALTLFSLAFLFRLFFLSFFSLRLSFSPDVGKRWKVGAVTARIRISIINASEFIFVV